MNTNEAVKPLQEYVNVPIAELVESSAPIPVRCSMRKGWRNWLKASAAKGSFHRSSRGE